MLVITRMLFDRKNRPGCQSIRIGEDIRITIFPAKDGRTGKVCMGRVCVGIEAPKDIVVLREEIWLENMKPTEGIENEIETPNTVA